MAFDHAFRAGLRSKYDVHDLGLVETAASVLAVNAVDRSRGDRIQQRKAAAAAELMSVSFELTEPQARACFHLAGFEVLYRSGSQDRLEYEPTPTELDELRQLHNIIPWPVFVPESQLVLNPSFNEGSIRVRGADGDIMLDDMIVDVKTVSDSVVTIARIRQVVYYALLANQFGITGLDSTTDIDRVGIYFTRAGVLTTLLLRDVVAAEESGNIVAWLTSRMGRSGSTPAGEAGQKPSGPEPPNS